MQLSEGSFEPVQRDLYSAFLAFCCEANILDISRVKEIWPTAEPLLRQAMSGLNQSASGSASSAPQGISLGADRLSQKDIVRCEAVDVVAQARATESIGATPSEPPGFSHGEVQHEKSIALKAESACPKPAGIGLFDFRPETFLYSKSGHASVCSSRHTSNWAQEIFRLLSK